MSYEVNREGKSMGFVKAPGGGVVSPDLLKQKVWDKLI